MDIAPKTPAEVVPVMFDYRTAVLGDTVASATMSCMDAFGIDQSSMLVGPPVIRGKLVTQLVSGGTVGRDYTVTCLATFSRGAVLQAEATFSVVVANP